MPQWIPYSNKNGDTGFNPYFSDVELAKQSLPNAAAATNQAIGSTLAGNAARIGQAKDRDAQMQMAEMQQLFPYLTQQGNNQTQLGLADKQYQNSIDLNKLNQGNTLDQISAMGPLQMDMLGLQGQNALNLTGLEGSNALSLENARQTGSLNKIGAMGPLLQSILGGLGSIFGRNGSSSGFGGGGMGVTGAKTDYGAGVSLEPPPPPPSDARPFREWQSGPRSASMPPPFPQLPQAMQPVGGPHPQLGAMRPPMRPMQSMTSTMNQPRFNTGTGTWGM